MGDAEAAHEKREAEYQVVSNKRKRRAEKIAKATVTNGEQTDFHDATEVLAKTP